MKLSPLRLYKSPLYLTTILLSKDFTTSTSTPFDTSINLPVFIFEKNASLLTNLYNPSSGFNHFFRILIIKPFVLITHSVDKTRLVSLKTSDLKRFLF